MPGGGARQIKILIYVYTLTTGSWFDKTVSNSETRWSSAKSSTYLCSVVSCSDGININESFVFTKGESGFSSWKVDCVVVNCFTIQLFISHRSH